MVINYRDWLGNLYSKTTIHHQNLQDHNNPLKTPLGNSNSYLENYWGLIPFPQHFQIKFYCFIKVRAASFRYFLMGNLLCTLSLRTPRIPYSWRRSSSSLPGK